MAWINQWGRGGGCLPRRGAREGPLMALIDDDDDDDGQGYCAYASSSSIDGRGGDGNEDVGQRRGGGMHLGWEIRRNSAGIPRNSRFGTFI